MWSEAGYITKEHHLINEYQSIKNEQSSYLNQRTTKMESVSDDCIMCKKPVRERQQGVQCDGCLHWNHRTCNTGKWTWGLRRTNCCSWCFCMFFVCANERDTKWMLCVHVLKLGNICCGHTMFLKKTFFVSHNLCPQKMLRAQTGKHLCRQQCVLVWQGL